MRPSRTAIAKGAAVSLGSFLVFGIVTGLIPNPIYIRKVPRTPFDYTFLILTSLFVGIYIVQQSMSTRATDDRLAFGSTIVGFLSFACPVCNVLLLALFSNSMIMTYFDPLRPVLGVLSVVLFAGLIYYRRQKNCRTCGRQTESQSSS